MSRSDAMRVLLMGTVLAAIMLAAQPAHAARDQKAPKPALEALNPEMAAHPYRLAPGPRPFEHRMSLSPAYGYFGSEELYALRLTYNPDSWLGYEAQLGHNPGQAVHAVIHSVSAVLRYPLPGRLQPYVSAGYGMVMVFPGLAVNAKPVTKNALAVGGGLELYIRTDLAVRAEMRHATVIGSQRDSDDIVAYEYAQGTIGLAFYRSIQP